MFACQDSQYTALIPLKGLCPRVKRRDDLDKANTALLALHISQAPGNRYCLK